MSVGIEIRRQRKALGMTGAELAEKAGLAPSAVSQIETGRRTPSSTSVFKLAEALGVGVGELYPKAEPRLPLDDDYQPPQLSAEALQRIAEQFQFQEAAGLIYAADAVADTIEHAVAREDHGLEELSDAWGLAEEFYPYFRTVSKRLPKETPTWMQDEVQKLDPRLKAARTAVRKAYRARREEAVRRAEEDALNVVRLQDEKRREKREWLEAAGA